MKFTCSVEIDLQKDKVVTLWKDPENLKHWQDNFKGFEHLSDNPESVGAKSMLYYNMKGGKTMELEETILEWNMPHAMEGEYVHRHMTNRMRNTFQELGPEKTVWTADITYTKFNGLFMKLFAMVGKGMFRKQTQKWLNQFKEFAESQ